jgi:hypothetical protein
MINVVDAGPFIEKKPDSLSMTMERRQHQWRIAISIPKIQRPGTFAERLSQLWYLASERVFVNFLVGGCRWRRSSEPSRAAG